MNSATIMGEVGDGYSVKGHDPAFSCGHCGKTFPVTAPTIYVDHVPPCLEAHIAELLAHGLVARTDDTYTIPRQIGWRRIDSYQPRRAVGWGGR